MKTVKGFVSEDSKVYGILGILSVVGVVVHLLTYDLWILILTSSLTSLLKLKLFSNVVHDHLFLARNGAHSLAYNVRGAVFLPISPIQIGFRMKYS